MLSSKDESAKPNYVLITPVKNEKENLLGLRSTIIGQTIRPLLWTIVDSGSSDDTLDHCRKLFSDLDWVEIIEQEQFHEKGYSHKNFAQAIDEGYSHLKKIAIDRCIKFSYIGKTDASPILSEGYFQALMKEMERNKELAITCGIQKLIMNNRVYQIEPVLDSKFSAFNDIRLYRKDFFELMGGYPITYSPDIILLIKAKKSGWSSDIVRNATFIKHRLGGSKIGKWKGYELKGRAMYCLGYHPILVFLNSAYHSMKFRPHYVGFGILQGYIISVIRKEDRTDDMEIIEYFRHERLREILNDLRKHHS